MNKEMIRIKAAEGIRICHLIDEDGIHHECITQGDNPSIRSLLFLVKEIVDAHKKWAGGSSKKK